MRRMVLVVTAATMLAAGGAAAAVAIRTVTLKPGTCVKASKALRVCAAKVRPAPPVTATVTVTTTPTPQVAFRDGTYRVGVDVQPGTYQASGGGSLCYWARLSGFSGNLDDIIANSTDQTIVTIEPTDAGFQSNGCGSWSKIG